MHAYYSVVCAIDVRDVRLAVARSGNLIYSQAGSIGYIPSI